MSAEEATVKHVSLHELSENDYNPRKTFDTAAMEDLKESIDRMGLIQPLTVRENGGGFEVISGARRLRALRSLYDDNHEVPVHVRDVNDKQAKWIALAENLDRDDLSVIEEARAYAEAVEIEVDGETQSFMEYINGVGVFEGHAPTERSESVQELAEKVQHSGSIIRKRLQLLTLPESIQTDIENGEVMVRVGEILYRLNEIDDADKRGRLMEKLANDSRFRGGSPDTDALRDRIGQIIEEHNEEQEQQEQKLKEHRELVEERAAALWAVLNNDLQWADSQFDESVTEATFTNGDQSDLAGVDDSGEPADDVIDVEVQQVAKGLIDRFQERRAQLGSGEIDALDDREDRLRQDRDRLKQNIETIRQESLDRCPFCQAGVSVRDLEQRVEEYDTQIDSLQEQKRSINERRSDLRDRRREVREKLNKYQDAVQTLSRVAREVNDE